VEYMAGGLPLLSTIPGELQELLKTYDCGVTYAADSSDELANALLKLRDNPARCKEMGARSYQLFEERFRCDVVARAMSDHFEKVREQLIQ